MGWGWSGGLSVGEGLVGLSVGEGSAAVCGLGLLVGRSVGRSDCRLVRGLLDCRLVRGPVGR